MLNILTNHIRQTITTSGFTVSDLLEQISISADIINGFVMM